MDYKIEVKSKEEACVAGYLAQTLGYKMDTMFSEEWSKKYCYLLLCSDMSAGFGNESMTNGDEPMSMTELRALVSLHKNPINMDKVLSEVRFDALGLLKDKEYLRKNSNGTYSYIGTVRHEHVSDFVIEIPEGTIKARFYPLDPYGLEFENDKQQWWDDEEQSWVGYGLKEYAGAEKHSRIVWQRHTQPEELPFVDDEPSLNDQYAEIEQVRQASIADTLNERQSTYGDFKDVANTTQYLLQMLSTDAMSDVQLEALHMICSKLARIAHGDPNYKDNWHDIAGYATLVERSL